MLIQIQDKGVDFVDNKDLNSTKELKYPTCGRIGVTARVISGVASHIQVEETEALHVSR
ncbi:MAG: hypothetical protein BECKG1743D_GA0114223_112981, partial [Candidatus Kentron sp. G]